MLMEEMHLFAVFFLCCEKVGVHLVKCVILSASSAYDYSRVKWTWFPSAFIFFTNNNSKMPIGSN